MRSIAFWPTVIVLLIAVRSDLKFRRIPNLLVIPFLTFGIFTSFWVAGSHGLWRSLEGIGTGALIFGSLFYMQGMGMGDVKLWAAIGAWIGPGQLFVAIVLAGIAGGVMAVCWAIGGGFLPELMTGAGDILFGLRRRKLRPHPDLLMSNPRARKMPYAPAIAIGTLISFFPR